MKKKMMPLLGCIAAIVVLMGLYLYKSGTNSSNGYDTEATTEDTAAFTVANTGEYELCNKSAEDITDILITRDGTTTLEMTFGDGTYNVKGYEKVSLNTTNTASVASIFIGLYSDNKVDGELASFGLDNPVAVGKATFKDGSEITLNLGNLTPDGKYYYMQSSEADGIYLVDSISGGRMLYTVNQLVDKDIPSLKTDYINYIEVTKKNGDELLMYYNENYSNKDDALAQSGLSTLTMEKPFKGLSVYPYNLESSILSTCSNFAISDVVDAQPDDYSKYGLDEPNLVVGLGDDESAVQFKVGNDTDDGKVYVTVSNKVSVFTMDKSLFEPFESYNVTDFVERFVSIHYRYELAYAAVNTEYGSFKLEFKEDGDKKITVDEKGATKDTRRVMLDGKEISNDDYIDIHGVLVGLTFDSIVEPKAVGENPDCEITYGLLDGSEQSIKFYSENDNFYRVPMADNYDVLVDKQSVKNIINKANQLK